MIFYSKMDKSYIILLLILVMIIGVIASLPFIFGEGLKGNLLSTIVLLTLMGFILWIMFSIQYVFKSKYLLVKGGPIKSRIPYENITKISHTTDTVTGYKILMSGDALEIFYDNAILWGSVKISPKNKIEFIDELKKDVQMRKFSNKQLPQDEQIF